MQYKNFERALLLHTRIKNILDKIKVLQDALREPMCYHLVLESCQPGVNPIDFFSNGEEPYIIEVVTRYISGLEDELRNLIAEFEALE